MNHRKIADNPLSQDFTLIIITGFILGVFITVFGIIFIDSTILGLGASSILYPYCKEYLFILLLITPASIITSSFSEFYYNSRMSRNRYAVWHKCRISKYLAGLHFYGAYANGY